MPGQLLLLTPSADASQCDDWAGRARDGGWRLLGPSSAGFVRPHRGLNLGGMGMLPPAGEIALVSQSGALGAAMLDWAQEVGAGFSLVVALGDEVDVDLAQALEFVASDMRTRSVIVYLEHIFSPHGRRAGDADLRPGQAIGAARRFISALRALSLAKPVIVLKGGRFAAGVPGLAGASDAASAVYEAALRRAGAVQIQIFAQVEIIARYLAARSSPVGPRLGIVANGRGPAVLAIDEAIGDGMRVPTVAEPLVNPTLLGADETPTRIVDALQALGESRSLDALLLVIAPHRSLDAEALLRGLAERARDIDLPVFAALLGSERMREAAHALEQCGIPVFATPEAAVNAYAHVARFHENQKLLLQMPRPLSDLPDPDLDRARAIVDRVLRHEPAPASSDGGAVDARRVLSAADAKALLTAFHVPMVDPQPARSADEAITLANGIGYPVALKVMSPDVPFKSAVGGVLLNLHGPEQVASAFRTIMLSVSTAAPDARIDGVSVQAMRGSSGSAELKLAVHRDRLWGPVMRFGAGGAQAGPQRRDGALELPPLNRFVARKLIERSRVYAWLAGRSVDAGRLEADLDGIERILLRVSEIVCEMPRVVEIDLNPVIVDSTGVTVVDARIVVEPAPPAGLRYSHMAIMPYPTYLEQRLQTRTGRPCTIRPIQPEDAEPLQAMVRRLSPQARYFRFVSTLTELPPRLLLKFTQIDYDREVALVAVSDGDDCQEAECIVGVGRYMLNPDGETCEFAIAIDDAWQGAGLGGHLMNSLVALASQRGLKRIEGHVLATNYPMLGLMRHIGFQITAEPDEPDMRLVWRDLPVT
ncbi:MAG: GNAT family N-acetyltransferase [Burkholderiaceae bacterium]